MPFCNLLNNISIKYNIFVDKLGNPCYTDNVIKIKGGNNVKTFEAIYNGYRVRLKAPSVEDAIEVSKKEFMKSLRLKHLNEMFFSIKEEL